MAVCEISGLTAIEMTSVLIQAILVTDKLVLNGWHLLPSLLNAAGRCGERHSSAFVPQDFCKPELLAVLSPLNLRNKYFPSQEGRAYLPSAHTCVGEPCCVPSSLTAGVLLIWQVPLCVSHIWREKARRAGCHCWAHPGCSATAPCLWGGSSRKHVVHPQQRSLVYLVKKWARMIAQLHNSVPGSVIP